MRDIRKLGALAFIALGALPFGATAADGGVCVSQLFTTTIASPIGTINYPQLTNSTKFTCGTATQYTIKQLSQAGWIIDNMQLITVSSTTTATGASTVKTRVQLTIQK